MVKSVDHPPAPLQNSNCSAARSAKVSPVSACSDSVVCNSASSLPSVSVCSGACPSSLVSDAVSLFCSASAFDVFFLHFRSLPYPYIKPLPPAAILPIFHRFFPMFYIFLSLFCPFKIVNPVRFQEIHKENNRADRPRQRIRPEDHLDLRNKMHGYRNVCDPDDTP